MTLIAGAPDLAAIKQRQQATWASGDFSVVAARIQYQAEQLCETADLQAGWRVLDVATGKNLGSLALGAGIDIIAYSADLGHVYVASGKTATI